MKQSSMTKRTSNAFVYNWQIEEEIVNGDMQDEIYIYGKTETDKTLCLRVSDFDPTIYVELPSNLAKKCKHAGCTTEPNFNTPDQTMGLYCDSHKLGGMVAVVQTDSEIVWDSAKAQLVVNYINNRLDPYGNGKKKNQIVLWSLEYMHKLYYAHIDTSGEIKKFPYLKLRFKSMKTAKKVLYMSQVFQTRQLQVLNVVGIGAVRLKVNECEATSILQLSQRQDIPTCGWVTISGLIEPDVKVTSCFYEYRVSYRNIQKCNEPGLNDTSIVPTIFSFDIECNSTIQSAMPKAENPLDVVFQIGICISTKEQPDRRLLLSLGVVDDIEDVEILPFENESKLLLGFTDLVRKVKPQIITGYNIFSFDLPYLLKRTEMYGIKNEFLKMGFRLHKSDEVRQVNWSSKAYSKQELEFIDTHGILMLDALPVIKRDYKFSNYKLSTVAHNLIGKDKDPLNAYDIFNCYLIGMKGGVLGRKALQTVGKYCVVDTSVTLEIVKHTNMWVSLSEMAKTCNVPISYLFTKGEQIKAYSQIFCESKRRNYVVETNVIEVPEDFSYTGALVIEPTPGIYTHVVPFDFTSLYPTTIISYNIDYTTFVDENNTTIPDDDCHVFEWSEHQGCEHDQLKISLDKIKEKLAELRIEKKTASPNKKKGIDFQVVDLMQQKSAIHLPSNVICKTFRYKFLKKPLGIVPTMLTNLLNERKKVKNVIRENTKAALQSTNKQQAQLQSENSVLDKRQLSYKIAANSMYGCMGVKRGYLPLPQGACCTTAQGRVSITKAQDVLKKNYNATIVYGDTDSCYVQFDNIKQDCLWNHCLHIESELVKNKIFPAPMKLAFEESVYPSFLIMSKKRYMATSCDQNGKMNDSIVKKGVLLSRRDNCNFSRTCYRKIIDMVFASASYSQCISYLESKLHDLVSNKIPITEFHITKSVQSRDDYKLKRLDQDPIKRAKQLKDVGFIHQHSTTSDIFDLYTRINSDKVTIIKKLYKQREQQIDHVFGVLSTTYGTTDNLVILQELYYEFHSLPAVAQLAEKMKSRGTHVPAGSRIEYVYAQSHTGIDKLWDKIEDAEYFSRHSDVLSLDFPYYIKSLVNPIDEIFEIVFKVKNSVKDLYLKANTSISNVYVSIDKQL